MPMAAFIGTTVGYTDYFNSVFLEKDNGSAIVISKKTFEYLYYRLDPFIAALKEDCIEYVSNSLDDPLRDPYREPQWYIDAMDSGQIYETCGAVMWYEEDGEIMMSPDSVILRNFKGELRYMEFEDFIKYYDIPGSEFID